MSEVLKHYDYLHTIPEPSMQEYKTAAYLADELEKCGYEVKRGLGGATGVVGILDTGVPGPTLGLRADMDSLTHIIDGVTLQRHTCGHDAHCSMLLTAAKELMARGSVKKGKLKVFFQPGEEVGQGALSIIDSGEIDGVDLMFGMHLRPIQECAEGEVIIGMNYSASYNIKVTIQGAPAHGARPHLGINPIDAAMSIIGAVNSIHMDPRVPFSAKCTRIHADAGVVNSIPEFCTLNFDMRSQNNEVMTGMKEKVKKALEFGAAAVGAKIVDIEEIVNLPTCDLDDEMTALVEEVVKEQIGVDAAKPPFDTSGGEDFFWYKVTHPTMKVGFAGLGVGCVPGMHHPDMHFNKALLENGVKLHIGMVEKILG